MKRKILRIVGIVLTSLFFLIILLSLAGKVAEATELVDDTVKAGNLYSQYSLGNCQLDFSVNSSWGWLPWNWGDGLGKSVMYSLYAITNFIWTVSLYLSNATDYVVQEAYKLNFISDTAESIGKNIQTLAGINENGLQPSGFYFGSLVLVILVLDIYVVYIGLLKWEAIRTVRAVISFVAIFLLSGSFIAYVPNYITKINDSSSDISESALGLGTKIIIPNSENHGENSVDLVHDSLFSIQVQQPWLLLQFDNPNVKGIGEERVNKILSVSPDENKGKDHEEAVKAEIEGNGSTNLSIAKTMSRLGTVVFLVLFNIGISFFVSLLTGIILLSQILFIIFAMFLPTSFLLSMLPTYEGLGKKAIVRLFNTVVMRAGVTLVVTTAFNISTIFFSISATYPFFMVAFLQIVTFAGIYFRLGDIMSMFNLQSNDSQSMNRRVVRKSQMLMNCKFRQFNQNIGRALAFDDNVAVVDKLATDSTRENRGPKSKRLSDRRNQSIQGNHEQNTDPKKQEKTANSRTIRLNLMGRKAGKTMDSKSIMKDKVKQAKDHVIDTPTNLKYNLHRGVERTKSAPGEFGRGFVQEKKEREKQRKANHQQRQKRMNRKRQALGNRRTSFLKCRTSVSTNTFPSSKDHSSLSQRQVVKNFRSVPVLQNRQKDSLQTVYPRIAPRMMSIKKIKNQSALAKNGGKQYQENSTNREKVKTGDMA